MDADTCIRTAAARQWPAVTLAPSAPPLAAAASSAARRSLIQVVCLRTDKDEALKLALGRLRSEDAAEPS